MAEVLEQNQTHTAYCVKCREHRLITNPQKVTMKSNRPAVKGKCQECGTVVFKIVPKRD